MWTVLSILFYGSLIVFVLTNHVMVNIEYKNMLKRHVIQNREIAIKNIGKKT